MNEEVDVRYKQKATFFFLLNAPRERGLRERKAAPASRSSVMLGSPSGVLSSALLDL